MGPSKNVNHRNLAKLFLQRFSDNFPKFIENEGGPLKSVEKGPYEQNVTDAPSRYVNGNTFRATFN